MAPSPTPCSSRSSLLQTNPHDTPRATFRFVLGAHTPFTPPTALPGRGGQRTWQAGALVRGVTCGPARAPVLAGGGAAGHVGQLAVLAGVGGAADTAVGADLVEAGAPVAAGRGVHATLVHVLPAGGAVEAGRAAADVGGLEGQALATVGTGVGGARVRLLARFPWWARRVRGALWLPCPQGASPQDPEVWGGEGPSGILSLTPRTRRPTRPSFCRRGTRF